uniref:THAP-type domain-containing protein n=1 Tax=Anopheles coluzzii TaxID=1518534 RepID=A0A6E8V077_ANOCL
MHSYRANVNRKHCAYFRCNNNSVSTPDITFFGFPKPFDRYETWMKFAGVPHELLENKRYRYLCERHFADIYMCRSQRRTLLLGNAVPYPFDQSIVTDCDASEGTVEVYEMESDGTLAKVAPLRPLDDNEGAESTDMEQTSETDTEALSSPTVTVVRSSTSEELQDTLRVEEVPDSKKGSQKEEPKSEAVSSAGSSHKQKLVASKIAEMKVKVRNTAAAGAITPNHREAAGKRVVLNGKTIRLVPIQFRNIMHKQSETDPEVTIVDNDHEDGGKPDEASGEVPNASKNVKSPVSSSTNSHDETVEGREDEPAESSAGGQQATERDDKISEFIFKGEEYVQMPKAHFLGKLGKLEQRVAHYESVIRNMRSILDHASPFGSTDG